MSDLDRLYVRLLHYGLMMLQHASHAGDVAWVHAEVEMLHNVPSLIGETNALRHEYFWNAERVAYIEWLDGQPADRQEMILVYYQRIWDAIEKQIVTLGK